MENLMEHFGNDARHGQSEAARRRMWFIKARSDRFRQDQIAEQAELSTLSAAVAITLATDAQIAAFETKLDLYDEATTKALIANQREFEQLQKRLEEIEDRLDGVWEHANVMDDGRRVFLNRERTKAYDEFGTEVSDEEYSYDLFPESHLPVDEFLPDLKARGEVHDAITANRIERKELHEFQDKLDNARDRLAEGNISEAELNELDADLAAEMPTVARKHVPGFDTADNAPDLKSGFTAPANAAKVFSNAGSSVVPELTPTR